MGTSCYVPVAGTWGWVDPSWDPGPQTPRNWWQPGSPFHLYLLSQGLDMVDPEQPFVWTTDLGGVEFWRRWKVWGGSLSRDRDHRDWVAGGINLGRYLASLRAPVPLKDRNVVAHSHGGQVVFYACALGLQIRKLMTVGTPERADLRDIVRRARPNILWWGHLYDQGVDRIAEWGELGDGSLSTERDFTDWTDCGPDVRIAVPEVSHSRVLYDPTRIPYWGSQGWVDLLK